MVKNGGFPFGDMRCVCVIYMVILCMVYSQEGIFPGRRRNAKASERNNPCRNRYSIIIVI